MATQPPIKIHEFHDNMQRLIHFYNLNRDSNLVLIQTGRQERCYSTQVCPKVRDHYLLHFVISGSGRLHLANASYTLTANDCFLIYPDELSTYHSLADNSWSYYWIGIDGTFAETMIAQTGFQPQKQAVHFSNPTIFAILEQILDAAFLYQNDLYALDLQTCSLLYQLFSMLYLFHLE